MLFHAIPHPHLLHTDKNYLSPGVIHSLETPFSYLCGWADMYYYLAVPVFLKGKTDRTFLQAVLWEETFPTYLSTTLPSPGTGWEEDGGGGLELKHTCMEDWLGLPPLTPPAACCMEWDFSPLALASLTCLPSLILTGVEWSSVSFILVSETDHSPCHGIPLYTHLHTPAYHGLRTWLLQTLPHTHACRGRQPTGRGSFSSPAPCLPATLPQEVRQWVVEIPAWDLGKGGGGRRGLCLSCPGGILCFLHTCSGTAHAPARCLSPPPPPHAHSLPALSLKRQKRHTPKEAKQTCLCLCKWQQHFFLWGQPLPASHTMHNMLSLFFCTRLPAMPYHISL